MSAKFFRLIYAQGVPIYRLKVKVHFPGLRPGKCTLALDTDYFETKIKVALFDEWPYLKTHCICTLT